MNRTSPLPGLAACVLLLAGLAGCSVLKNNEEAQAVINQRVVGMPAGDFFQQYGRWRSRVELPGGAMDYRWESGIGAAAPGPGGLDERVCKLHILADKVGRVESATIAQDNPGRTSTSRCGEMFKSR